MYNRRKKLPEIKAGLILIGAVGFYVIANFIRYYLHYFIGIKENSIFALTVYDIAIIFLMISLYRAAVKIVIKKESKRVFAGLVLYLTQYAVFYQIIYYFYMEADYSVKNKIAGVGSFFEDIGLLLISFFILIKTLKCLKKIEDGKFKERAYIVISLMIFYAFISLIGIENFYYDTIVLLYPITNIYLILIGIKEYEKEGKVQSEINREIKTEEEEPAVIGIDEFSKRYGLTSSENEILGLLYRGYTNAEIAELRKTSINTVKRHVYNIFKKADVENRIELIHMIKSE